MNLGLRYQIQGGWSEIHNRLGDFDPTLLNPATNTLGAMWFGGNNGRTNLEANNKDLSASGWLCLGSEELSGFPRRVWNLQL